MSWATLSVDIWTKILQFVPPDCLGPCSTVSKALHQAAAAATTEVFFDQGSAQHLAGLLHWMLRYGRHITSIVLRLPAGTFLSSVQPGVDKIADVLGSCTQLRKLALFLQSVGSFAGVWAALSALPELQQLDLGVGDAYPHPDHRMPSTVLQQLQHLTHLHLYDVKGCLFDTQSLQHISCLTNLQALHIIHHEGVALCPSSIPGINRLTALQCLCLWSVSLDPAVLQDCTQLRRLVLENVSIITGADAACLLSLAGRLPQLLEVEFKDLEYPWPVAAAAYTSLTANSKLQRLVIDIEGLPPGVWQYLFPAGCQWPALQCLVSVESAPTWPPPAAALGTDDLSRLVSCCPGLLHVVISLQPGAQLAPLAQLSALTCLNAGNADVGAFESLSALTGLVSLQNLLVHSAEAISPQSLLRLTAMTGLTALRIISAPDEENVYGVDLIQDQERPIPVWFQLFEQCGRYDECMPSILRYIGQQFNAVLHQQATQQQQNAVLQQQNAVLQQQNAVLQQQNALLQQQNAELQQQLSSSRAEAAADVGELRGQLRALEGQVQQLMQALKDRG